MEQLQRLPIELHFETRIKSRKAKMDVEQIRRQHFDGSSRGKAIDSLNAKQPIDCPSKHSITRLQT